MNFKSFALCLAVGSIACVTVLAEPGGEMPRLEKRGQATQLIVDGKPWLILGGETANTASSDLAYMNTVWPQLARLNLNTVLVAVAWSWVEPAEGRFDFTLVDGLLDGARQNNLRVVFLWFGSWKNGLSSFVPAWVKADQQRFPRVQIKSGKSIEVLSTFSDANREADTRAYVAFMRHLKEVDRQRRTCLMIQLQNEVGVLGDSRDRSAAANAAFAGAVPKELMGYLGTHKAAQSEPRQTLGRGRRQDDRYLGTGLRRRAGDRRDLHGLALCPLHGAHDRGGQGRVSAAGVHQYVDRAARGPRAWRLPERRPGAPDPRHLEGRRAVDRYQRARHLPAELHRLGRLVSPARQSTLRARVTRRRGRRGQCLLHHRPARGHRLLAVRHRQHQPPGRAAARSRYRRAEPEGPRQPAARQGLRAAPADDAAHPRRASQGTIAAVSLSAEQPETCRSATTR